MTSTCPTPATRPESAGAILRQMEDPEFVASLSEERVVQLRQGLAPVMAWHPWVFNSLTALLIIVGCAILATKLPVPFAPYGEIAWAMPLGGMAVGLLVMSMLTALFHAPADLHVRLTPLSQHFPQCRQALNLVQASPWCQAYQAKVLAHPREFLVADLQALELLTEREKEANATRERQEVCAALHQLDVTSK